MTYLERMLADGTDREAWKLARKPVIGASDAKILSKMSSVPLYLAGKLKREVFTGNVFTETGYRWEPLMLAWGGFDHNVALFHAPDEPGFAATPDGIKQLSEPFADQVGLAECKVKHVEHAHQINGPTLGEFRQLAWQFRVFPEAYSIDWICQEIDKHTDEPFAYEPWSIRYYRDDPQIIKAAEAVEPIARDLLTRLTAALEFERTLA